MGVSSTQVSRAAAELDELLEAWRASELGRHRYIILDAQHEKVRQGGAVFDAAIPIACAVGADGKRGVLVCAVSLSEAEVRWRTFLAGLKDRGLLGVELIVSDAYEGLQAARKAVFGSIPWQRSAKADASSTCNRMRASMCRLWQRGRRLPLTCVRSLMRRISRKLNIFSRSSWTVTRRRRRRW